MAVSIIAIFLATAFVGALSGARAPEGAAKGQAFATADGLYWQDDRRLTENGADDLYPTLVVDSFGYSHIMWYRTGTHMYKKIDRYGNELFSEKTVVTAQMPTQHCGQVTERIGIDGQENFHVVWTTQSLYGPMYQKFSSTGNPLCQPINLAPMASMPHVVGLAVGKNNRGYFAYENEGSERIEMAYTDSSFNLHTGYLSTTSGEGVTIGLDKKDNPYIFSKSWSSTGMWMTKFSSEAQLLLPPTKIETPVAGSGWDSPLPSLAFGSDGAIHMLQASRASGIKTLYYTKLGPDGTKLTDDKVITMSSNDFGDICVDSKLNVFIIWGDSNEGKIFYVRIVPQHENDTLNPVKLTNSNGIDRDPQIAVDPEDSLHTAWVSDRDGNKEIYYKFAFSYGVELTMTPEEMAKIMYIKPNETKSANITVRNMGGQNDTMYMGVLAELYGKPGGTGKDYKGDGYKIWLDERYKEIEMDAQEVRKVPITVRGPSKGIPNEYITVTVHGTSKMNPMKNDTVTFRIYLVVDHRILLKCGDHVHTTSAGVATQFLISVGNIGDIEERVNLSTSGPPGWDFQLNYDEVRLRPGENAMVTLTVIPPPDAQAEEVGIVTVTGRSSAQPSVKDTVSTHTLVTPYMYIELTVDKSEDFVDPGNHTTFTLTVWNYGNMAGTVMIILEIMSGSGEWITSLDSNAVGVAGGEGREVLMTVVAPLDAPAGSRLIVRVQGFNAERTLRADVVVTTIVKQIHRIKVANTPEVVAVYPGEKANFEISASNFGNGAEEVRLSSSDLPVGWDIAYVRPDNTIINEAENLYLEAGSTTTFNAVITTSASALAKKYDSLTEKDDERIMGKLTDKDGNDYPILFTLIVNQVFDIDITTTMSKLTGVPGRTVQFTLIGKNKGNGLDTLTFETNLPREYAGYEFRDVNYILSNEMTLNSSGLERMTLTVPIPSDANGTTVEFLVTARSLGAEPDSVKLVIDIKMANLVISKVVYSPTTLKNNKLATIVVTIDNIGDVSVENVTVRFLQDRTIINNERLERVSGGSNRTVTFTWLAKSGSHNLRFVVDPDNLVVESNKNDNAASENVKVQSGGFLEMPGFEAPFLLMALAAGAALLVLRRRK